MLRRVPPTFFNKTVTTKACKKSAASVNNINPAVVFGLFAVGAIVGGVLVMGYVGDKIQKAVRR